MFFKKEDQFSVYLKEISANLVESTNYFTEYKLRNKSDTKEFFNVVKNYETQGDTLVHKVIHNLNKVFITPIEREDILALAMHMDDVLDGLESAAAMFEMYEITEADDFMVQFVEAIQLSVIEIDKAVDLLNKKKLLDMRQHAILIKDYESKCDGIRRESIKQLFKKEKDPIRIIQYKEIYEELEEVADCCEDVANIF
ncbi:MAG TPA: DUF47 family protein, partial [Pseudogracilibacillus sp.]|nr:DUF47 family protein [Pseudogracilibacillus sp.]